VKKSGIQLLVGKKKATAVKPVSEPIPARPKSLTIVKSNWNPPKTPAVNEGKVQSRIGISIRRIREELGLTQEMTAERAGLHAIYYGNVERGKNNISIVALAKIARALECTVADLVTGAEI